MVTTIQVENKLKEKLDSLKVHHRESYNELITRLVENVTPKNIDKESLIETVEVLSDPDTMRRIAEAQERINKGDYGVSFGEAKKELGIK